MPSLGESSQVAKWHKLIACLSRLPDAPKYSRATPTEWDPFFGIPGPLPALRCGLPIFSARKLGQVPDPGGCRTYRTNGLTAIKMHFLEGEFSCVIGEDNFPIHSRFIIHRYGLGMGRDGFSYGPAWSRRDDGWRCTDD
jgi:hypothetical protein